VLCEETSFWEKVSDIVAAAVVDGGKGLARVVRWRWSRLGKWRWGLVGSLEGCWRGGDGKECGEGFVCWRSEGWLLRMGD